MRKLILKENKNKIGIYKWTNKLNNECYVGSSINLWRRFLNYFNLSYLSNVKNNLIISRALIKYGYSNFSLEILEYCKLSEAVLREQYYLDLLKPEYNILKTAGSTQGFKHSDETKALISRALVGKNNPFYNKNHSVESKLRIIEAKSAYPVYVYNSFKKLLVVFPSVNTLAKLINSNHSTIVTYIKNCYIV